MASPGDPPNACLLPFTQSKFLISMAHTQRKHFEMRRGQGYLGWYLSPMPSPTKHWKQSKQYSTCVSTRFYIFDRIVSKEPHLEDNFHKCSHLCCSSVSVVSWEFPMVTPKAWRKHTVRCPRRAAFAKAVPKEEESNRTQHWGPETQSRLLHHRKILGCGSLASWILNLQGKSMKQNCPCQVLNSS